MEKITNEVKKQIDSWQSFIDSLGEEIVILTRDKQVVTANKKAMEHFGLEKIMPYTISCKSLYKDICQNCKDCPVAESFLDNTQLTSIRSQSFGTKYKLTAKLLPNQANGEDWLLMSGKYINEKTGAAIGSNEEFEGIWILELDEKLNIAKSNQYAYQFTGRTKEMLEKGETNITELLTPEFKAAFFDFIEVAGKTKESKTIRLLVRKQDGTYYGGNATYIYQNLQNQNNHLIRIEPIENPDYGSSEHFENLRLQNFLHIISEQMAQSDTVEEGYKKIVHSIKEVLGVNLVGFLHYNSLSELEIEASLLNGKFVQHVEPPEMQPDKIPYFTSLLKKEDIIYIPDVDKTDLLIKEDLLQENIKSFYAKPLKQKKKLAGVLVLGYPYAHEWNQNKVDFVNTISSIILQNLLQDKTRIKLRRINENFVNIFENSSDAVFIVSLNGEIIEVNHTAETLTGYSKEELLKKNVADISKAENLDLAQLPYEMLQSHQMIFGTELKPRRGEPISIETREKMIRFHDKLSILVIARDVRHRRELSRMMVQTISETEDRERKRIAEGLHDDVGPLLSTLRIYIDLLRNEKLSDEEIEDFSHKMNDIINQAITSVREVSRNLMPGVLNDFGLVEAIKDFCNKITQTGIIRINFEPAAKYYNLEDKLKNIIYSVTKELVNNSIKHADASEINMQLNNTDNGIQLLYKDNGIGLDLKKQIDENYKGLGIKNLLNKVNAVSGKVSTLDERGFCIKIFFPFGNNQINNTNTL